MPPTHFRRLALSWLLGAFLFATGCASVQERGAEIARTWDGALVALPYASVSVGPQNVVDQSPLPTVLFLHTSVGIVGPELVWARALNWASR